MFSVLLYSWVVITILLVGIILYYIVNRFTQLGKPKEAKNEVDSGPLSSEEMQSVTDEEISEILDEEDIDEEIIEVIEDLAEAIGADEVVLEIETIELVDNTTEDINNAGDNDNESTNEEIEQATTDIIQEDPLINETGDEDIQIEESSDEIQSVVNTETSSTNSQTEPKKQYDYIFATDDNTPEIPKDLDSNRDIGKGHSRDDIVRDKFEKHIQKIRYEVGILKQRNDILGYEKKLVEGITLLPNDTEFQKLLADLYFHQGKYKKAQSLLKKILIENPSDHYALWQVGEIATVEGNNEDAYLYLQQAYATCEDNPKYCFSLAQWYYDHDALDQALPLMEKMVKLRPKNIDYIVSLSHVQHKMGMTEQAKQSLLRALELDPMNVTLKNYLKAL